MPPAARDFTAVKLQDLPPRAARFCLDSLRFLKEEGVFLSAGHVLVAFSGGADSTALLLSLHYLSARQGLRLTAAHLDHGLRPSAMREAEHCRALCEKLNIPFVTERCDIRAGAAAAARGIEDHARESRYAFFRRVAIEHECDWTALGHNANDLAEDILMRLIRGAGWPGLAGMSAIDAKRRLIRPLLATPRNAIEAFLTELGLAWVEDESNADSTYFRNRVRHKLLPLFLEENPDFLHAAARLWRLGNIDRQWLAGLLPTPETQDEAAPEDMFLASGTLRAMDKALRLRLYKQILDSMGGAGQARLENLLRLDAGWAAASKSGSGEQKIHKFPGGKSASVTAAGIAWQRPPANKNGL